MAGHFQSLLACYWSFPLATAEPSAKDGWEALRSWLASNLQVLDKAMPRKPDWMKALSSHQNLLSDKPCDRYATGLLAGDASLLEQALKELAIPSDSWVLDEAVLSQIRTGIRFDQNEFKAILPKLLSVAMGKSGISISKALQGRSVAILVSRYARGKDRPENPHLRDAAVGIIGNPWLRRSSWDALVVDAHGKPDEEAREMVNGWLKRRLITDFFELLSADGTGDTRRLAYWLRFEPFVDDMWFALGSNARERRGESFGDFKNRAIGRLLDLEQTTTDNNAFIMRMDGYLAVEFGVTGNAFFLFKWENLPKGLFEKLTSGRRQVSVEIASLKSSLREYRLTHNDSEAKNLSWEQKFDDAICPLIGGKPNQPPHRIGERASIKPPPQTTTAKPVVVNQRFDTVVEKLAASWKIKIEDKRSKGGALWLIVNDAVPTISHDLRALGFKYKAGKGWWKE